MDNAPVLTSEDKLWAALSHGSVIFSFWGPIIPALVWSTQRKGSAYARFHALQAFSYQVLSMWLWMVLMPVLIAALTAATIAGVFAAEASSPGGDATALIAILGPFVIWLPLLTAFGVYFLLGVVGAVAALLGRNFRYPLLGTWLARRLGYTPLDPASISPEIEDRLVASLSHATAIVLIFGAITPVAVWLTQKDRSPLLRFQSLQAAIYQGIGTVGYLAILFLYFFSMFGLTGLGLFLTGAGSNSSGDAVGLLMTIPILCFAGALLVAGPLFQLFAFIASLRVWRGRDYHYPLLGAYLRRRMGAAPATARETSA